MTTYTPRAGDSSRAHFLASRVTASYIEHVGHRYHLKHSAAAAKPELPPLPSSRQGTRRPRARPPDKASLRRRAEAGATRTCGQALSLKIPKPANVQETSASPEQAPAQKQRPGGHGQRQQHGAAAQMQEVIHDGRTPYSTRAFPYVICILLLDAWMVQSI